MRFGVCFAPDPSPHVWVEKAALAESRGFDYIWMWDSHVLWQDVYPVFTLMADRTERILMGPLVTNPITRDPTVTASVLATLDDISGGRMVMGIGRGDSARRVIGKTPVSVERLEEASRLIRDLVAGREVDYDGTQVRLPWAHWELPVWMAAYGPKALRAVGRVADGLIMQLADPFILEWSLRYVREGAEEAGRDPEEIRVMSAAPTFISDDLAAAREQVRWFPALVSNHVVDLVNRYAKDELPSELTDFIASRDHYDYSEHGQRGAEHADFVPDEIVDRFCVIGTIDECKEKLRELERLGVDQFNIYAMSVEGPDEIIETYGKEIIPEFS
ncbi:MAG TPA: TIGR03842 family LLM class F420-dependent oxidoreductase [Actinomycetota bacterium]|nr:TIGR03842 family LLM class F420-dependent oxidoreductase [Actinomycetota bacterium]